MKMSWFWLDEDESVLIRWRWVGLIHVLNHQKVHGSGGPLISLCKFKKYSIGHELSKLMDSSLVYLLWHIVLYTHVWGFNTPPPNRRSSLLTDSGTALGRVVDDAEWIARAIPSDDPPPAPSRAASWPCSAPAAPACRPPSAVGRAAGAPLENRT